MHNIVCKPLRLDFVVISSISGQETARLHPSVGVHPLVGVRVAAELHEHVRHQEELQEHLRPAAAGNASRAAAVHSLCKNPCCRTCTSAGSRRRAPVQDAQPIVARAKAAS